MDEQVKCTLNFLFRFFSDLFFIFFVCFFFQLPLLSVSRAERGTGTKHSRMCILSHPSNWKLWLDLYRQVIETDFHVTIRSHRANNKVFNACTLLQIKHILKVQILAKHLCINTVTQPLALVKISKSAPTFVVVGLHRARWWHRHHGVLTDHEGGRRGQIQLLQYYVFLMGCLCAVITVILFKFIGTRLFLWPPGWQSHGYILFLSRLGTHFLFSLHCHNIAHKHNKNQ